MDETQLAALLPDQPATSGPHVAVLVAPGRVDAVLDALLLHFEEHPDDELQVRRDDVTLGYIDAGTLYRIMPELTRGVGEADHYELPGDPVDELLVLDCPLGDYSLRVVLYPADHPPHCPNHPELKLRVRS